MKKFKFSLETARQLRQQRVEAETAELARLQQELETAHRRQRELEAEVGDAEALLREQIAHEAASLADLDRFRLASGKRRLRLAAEARAIGMRIGDQQKAVAEARRDLELLERLKEKARAKWQMEADREEQNLAEEVYLSRWQQRGAATGSGPESRE